MLAALEANGFLAGCGAVISGYLGEAAQSGVVREAVSVGEARQSRRLLSLRSGLRRRGRSLRKPGVAEAMARMLVPLADIVTPNRYELQSLTSRRCARPKTRSPPRGFWGRKAVLATSISVPEGLATVLAEPGSAAMTVTRRLANPPHGFGRSARGAVCGSQPRGPRAARCAGACGRVGRCASGRCGRAREMRLAAMQGALVTAEPLELQDLS